MKEKIKNKKGFTIIETLIGVSIFVLIVVVITLFSRNVWVYNSFVTAGLVSADAERQILRTMVSEIRTASTADTGAYTISQATASSFTFYSNIDSDSGKEKVRYFLASAKLQKGVTEPTGSPLYSGTEKISTLASFITNASIFSFYDKNYDGSEDPLTFPVNIADIRLVKITVTVDQDPNRAPAPKTFSTEVSIRNLKDNL